MINYKKTGITFALIWVLALIILSGCSRTNETEVNNPDNTNQPLTASNNNADLADSSTTPVPEATESSSEPTSASNNTSELPASNDKKNNTGKNAAAVKEPTPVIGSGGQDFFLLSKIRGVLSSEKELADKVVVDIKEGNVTLTGNVSDEAQKKKAEELIKSIAEIKSVKNNLRVSP